MIAARVTRRVTGTIKHPAYEGRSLLALQAVRRHGDGPGLVALDLVGAGVGDYVLVSRPPGLARELLGRPAPVRSLIIAILDQPPLGGGGCGSR